MTARKISRTWWVDFRVDHTRYRRRSPDNTRAGAQAYESTLRQRLARGLAIDGPAAQERPLFAAFAWTWFDDYVIPNNKFAEQRAKRGVLSLHLVPYFGRIRVDRIGPHSIEQFKAQQLKAGASQKTLRNRLTVLRKCLVCAHDWLEIETPVPKVQWPKCPPAHTDYLSFDETQTLLAFAHGLMYEMILTTLRTGVRQGELKGLQWTSIDWQNRSLTVRHSYCDIRKVLDTPKNGRTRHIPLDADVFALLRQRQRESGYVFLDGGKPFTCNKLNRRLAALCRRAGLRVITWHVLRHTFASNAAMRGVPLQIVQHLLGHSTVKTTERYAHVAPSMVRIAIDMLSLTGGRGALGQPAGNGWTLALKSAENSITGQGQSQKPR